jgi:hypothetical protein
MTADSLFSGTPADGKEVVRAVGGATFLAATGADVVLRASDDGHEVWRVTRSNDSAFTLAGVANDDGYFWIWSAGSGTLSSYRAGSATPWFSINAMIDDVWPEAEALTALVSDSTSTSVRRILMSGAESSVGPVAGKYAGAPATHSSSPRLQAIWCACLRVRAAPLSPA